VSFSLVEHNIMAESVATPAFYPGGLGATLDKETGYPDWGILGLSSVSPGKSKQYFKLGHKHFHLNSLFTNHPTIQCYALQSVLLTALLHSKAKVWYYSPLWVLAILLRYISSLPNSQWKQAVCTTKQSGCGGEDTNPHCS
jgi:hypothetical protein